MLPKEPVGGLFRSWPPATWVVPASPPAPIERTWLAAAAWQGPFAHWRLASEPIKGTGDRRCRLKLTSGRSARPCAKVVLTRTGHKARTVL